MSSWYKKEKIRSFDLGCRAHYDVVTGERFVVMDGVKYPAKVKYTKATRVEWLTVDGRWMLRVHAIREGVAVTGETRTVNVRGSSYYEATRTVPLRA